MSEASRSSSGDFVCIDQSQNSQTLGQQLPVPTAQVTTVGSNPSAAPQPNIETATGALMDIIKEDLGNVEDEFCTTQDIGLYCEMHRLASGKFEPTHEEVYECFEKLYWRACVQERFFIAFLFLHEQMLLDLRGFENHMDLDEIHKVGEQALRIFKALYAFKYVDSTFYSKYNTADYATPAIWLAVMISRSTTVEDPDLLFQRLLMEGIFGHIDEREYRKALPAGFKLIRDVNCGRTKNPVPSVSGWVIPRIEPHAGATPAESLGIIKRDFEFKLQRFTKARDAYAYAADKLLVPPAHGKGESVIKAKLR